ncbi:MAG: formylglycine-generating enzyme family protein [Candidatus Omnitrophota bacterium]|jgi:hypothetical protein|nr:MAG: formylglycine-generating enzyme family protein [Candidatus Omnitrophota bacterium]
MSSRFARGVHFLPFLLLPMMIGCSRAVDQAQIARITPTIVPMPKPTPSAMSAVHFYLADIDDAIQTTKQQLEQLHENERVIPIKIEKIKHLLVDDLRKLKQFNDADSVEKIQFHVLKQICIGLGLQYDWFTNKKIQNLALIESTIDKHFACEDIRNYLDITIQNMKDTPAEEHDQFFGMIKTTIDEVKKITETNEEFLVEFQKGPRSGVEAAAGEQYFEGLMTRFGDIPTNPAAEESLIVPLDLPPDAKPLAMVYVPPFSSNSVNSDNKIDQPAVENSLANGFFMSQYEITQAQWRAVMGNNPAHFYTHPNLPVEQVSWNDCQAFVDKMNQSGQGTFRLPTDAEWEYTCQAGNAAAPNNDAGSFCDELDSQAWFRGNAEGRTHEVGLKTPNPWGFFDMQGNVSEWCLDAEHSNRIAEDHPLQMNSYRIIRGGSWDNSADYCRVGSRDSLLQNHRSMCVGFRLVKE